MSDTKYKNFKDRYNNMEGYKKKFFEKYNKKIVCECGSCVTGLNMNRHLKSKKHKMIMDMLETYKKNLTTKK
jgi:hypothetical protein